MEVRYPDPYYPDPYSVGKDYGFIHYCGQISLRADVLKSGFGCPHCGGRPTYWTSKVLKYVWVW